ncbi:MAG: Holliday junction resolvase RuvX [Bacteroidales bacterium]|nr:Holliday junction resolvase RuvX [Bacteroidales bacterium]
MGRILAIDYGTKRVGLAVTDENQLIATGLDTVHSADVINYLIKYSECEPVECFVVGYPLQMNNTESQSVKYIKSFIIKLKKTFPDTPVETMDERFTSKMATQAILLSGVNRKKRQDKKLVDMVSAVLILQSYLDFKSKIR